MYSESGGAGESFLRSSWSSLGAQAAKPDVSRLEKLKKIFNSSLFTLHFSLNFRTFVAHY
jgi:hypothetical protein